MKKISKATLNGFNTDIRNLKIIAEMQRKDVRDIYYHLEQIMMILDDKIL